MTGTSYSVVIPCFNAAEFVAEAIRSVLAQSVPATEILVVDDGSTDASAAVAQAFGPAVTVIRQANGGVATARNRGIRAARGEWIAFLDADDLWEPDKMEKQLARANDGYGLVYCDAANFGAVGNLPPSRRAFTTLHEGWVFESLLTGNFITTSGVIVRRHILARTAFFQTQFSPAEDWALWLEAATLTRVGCVPECLVRYRVHAGGISRNTQRLHRGCRAALAWARGLGPAGEISRRTWRRAAAAVEGRAALGYDGDDRRWLAARAYARALRLDPRRWYWWKSLVRVCCAMPRM